MKRGLTLAGILMMGVAAVVVSERRKVDAPASPAALLYLIADTEQELTRMPVRFTRMSDQDEVRVGNEIAKSYSAARTDKSDAEVTEIQAYVTQVGSHVAAHAHRKLPYTFHYIPEKYFVNAFALPGGHVYIGEGLLALMDSEDQLAAVLGHAIDALEGYFRSHPLSAERIAQVNKMTASERWAPRAEHDLTVAYIFWMARAQNALDAGKYLQAQQLATRCLQMRQNLEKALMVLAQAQFAQADFAGAAASYRKILEVHGWRVDLANSYALSLAAADRPGAASEFRKWMTLAKADTRELQTPLDGLLLLADDTAPARKLQGEIRASLEDPSAPGKLSDLGG